MGFNILKSSGNDMLNVKKIEMFIFLFKILVNKCYLFIQNFGKIGVKNCKQTIY